MKLNRTGSNWNELERSKINENWRIIEGGYNDVVGQITDEVVGHLIDSAKLNWKEPVDSFADLPSGASEGDTRMVRDSGKVYRFNGEVWQEIQQIDAGPVNEMDARLTSQLAETEQQINQLESKKADRTYVNEELLKKMNVGDTITVSQIDKNRGKLDQTYMSEEFLQQMSGDTPINAVPADNSITSNKLTEGSVTIDKRTPLGNIGLLTVSVSSDIPNIDTFGNKVTFYGPFYVTYGNKRFTFSNTIDVPFNASGVTQYILFNIKTQTFRAIAGSNENRINEYEIIIMLISRRSTHVIRNIFATCDYTVNGESLTITKNEVENIINRSGNLVDFGIVLYGASNLETHFDFERNIVSFPYPFYVHAKSNRYDFTTGEGDSLEVPLLDTGNQFIYFNNLTREFRALRSAEVSTLNLEENTLIAFIQYGEISMIGKYSISSSQVEKTVDGAEFAISMESLEGWYNPDANETYDLFDYDTTTAAEVQDAFSSLANSFSDYITETNLGLDSSGDYSIYKYRLKPSHVDVPSLEKPFPKILIVCGLHAGSEKESIFSLFYFIKDICERWQEDPLLEYLRHNVEFVVIPNANPWGFDGGDYRRNFNGVDLNRNFGWKWRAGTEGSSTYGGTSAFSEKETQYVRDLILENRDALYFCDYHTNGSSGDVYDNLMWIPLNSTPFNNDNLNLAAKYTIQKCTREFIKKYNQPDNVGFFGYASNSTGRGTAKAYASSQGIPASTFECFRKFPTETEYHTPTTIKACTEYVGNWLVNIIKQFRVNNIKKFN